MWIDPLSTPQASNSHKWRSIGINNPGAACYLMVVGYIDPNTPGPSSKKLEEQDSHLISKMLLDVTKKNPPDLEEGNISHMKTTQGERSRKIRFAKCSTNRSPDSYCIYIYMSCTAWWGKKILGWCCQTVTDYSELSEAFTISTDHPFFFVSATTKMPMNSTNHLESRFGVIGLSCPLHTATFWEWLPSRELTYPTLGKRKIIFKMPFLGDMLVPRRVAIYFHYGVVQQVSSSRHYQLSGGFRTPSLDFVSMVGKPNES